MRSCSRFNKLKYWRANSLALSALVWGAEADPGKTPGSHGPTPCSSPGLYFNFSDAPGLSLPRRLGPRQRKSLLILHPAWASSIASGLLW